MQVPSEDIDDVAVNAAMNRGRGLVGVNSYERELRRFDIAAFLRRRAASSAGGPIRWLDACCGEGRALQEAEQAWSGSSWAECVEIVGIDLYDTLPAPRRPPGGPMLSFVAGDLMTCLPPGPFDLITCVHGLHYLPDKLGFLERAHAQLSPDGGLLLGHLDPANVRFHGEEKTSFWPQALRAARRQGVAIDLRTHLLRMERVPGSPEEVTFGAEFVTRTVSERANFSGMIVVDSWYAPKASVSPRR